MSAAPEMDPRWGLIEAYIADLGPVFRLRGKVPGGAAKQPWDEYTAFTVADIPTVFPLGGTWNMGLRLDLCPGLIVLDVDAVKVEEVNFHIFNDIVFNVG
jgi:hypothetical protein